LKITKHNIKISKNDVFFYKLSIVKSAKIPASTLVYAVFIMLIIAIICSSLILMSFYHTAYYKNYIEKDRVFTNVNSGINLLLAEQKMIEADMPTKLSLFNSYNDSVLLEWKQWGILKLIKSRSWWKNFEFQKVAFTGDYYKDKNSYAIYLADRNKPLSLCGKTQITGKCYLPSAGVKRAYIEGRNYEGNELIRGEIKYSADSLPEIKDKYKNLDLAYFQERYLENNSVLKFSPENIINDSLFNSFYDSTILIYSNDDLLLDQVVLTGNIVVLSEGIIEITNTCQLEDILIFGKSIWIENDFKGELQLFAKDTINIGENTQLTYPSVIGLINPNEEGNINPSMVNIKDGVNFFGVIYSASRSEVITIDPILKFGKNTVVSGQVYWEGIFNINGHVYGSVACKKFLLRTPSSIYENHLLDITIDLDELSEYYSGVELTNSDRINNIIKWLR